MRHRADLFLPTDEEFRRAMYCPDVEQERRNLAFEAVDLEDKMSRTDGIFSARPAYGTGGGYTYSLTLDPFQIQDLAHGKGKKFADYIVRKMIDTVVNGAIWGER